MNTADDIEFEIINIDSQDRRLELYICCDSTGSMAAHTARMTSVVTAVCEYLKGLVHSADFASKVHLTTYIVGLNDWRTGINATPPAKIFLCEKESTDAGYAVGYTFTLDKDDLAAADKGLKVITDAIEKMVHSIRTSGHSGGDLREEYGVGLNLVKTTVERSKSLDPENKVQRFLIGVTDDMQHGMGNKTATSHRSSGDDFADGVERKNVFGVEDVNAHLYKCAYAPDTVLGFKAWTPHSFFHSLNALLDMGMTVTWCAVGTSADPAQYATFEGWLGTLATIFEAKRGVLLSWCDADTQKPVPSTVVHLLNTLITSGDVDGELSVEKKSERLMMAAKDYSSKHGGVLQDVGTTVDYAATLLDQLGFESRLPEDEQKTFCDQSFKDLSGPDNVKLDSSVGTHYRSLSAKYAPSPPSPTGIEGGTLLCKRLSEVAPPCGECDDDDAETGARYRSLGASSMNAAPVYRSLGGGGVSAPTPPPPVVVLAPTPKRSRQRLLRLSTAEAATA